MSYLLRHCRKPILLIVLVSIYCSSLFGQTFNYEYGYEVDDRGKGAIETSNGNFLVHGTTSTSTFFRQATILSMDSYGQVQWQNEVGDSLYSTYFNDVIEVSDGTAVLVGQKLSFETDSASLEMVKINFDGEVIWSSSYSINWRTQLSGIVELPNGDLIGIGSTNPFTSLLFYDTFIARFSPTGDTLWTKTLPSLGRDFGLGLILNSNGNIVATGNQYDSSGSDSDIWLREFDLDGNQIWEEYYGTSLNDFGIEVKQNSSNEYFIVGENHDIPATRSDMVMVHTTSTGTELSFSQYGRPGLDESARDFIIQEPNELLLVGYAEDEIFEEEDAVLTKLNFNGDSLWTVRYGYDHDDSFTDVLMTSQGKLLMTGFTEGAQDIDEDILVVMAEVNGYVSSLNVIAPLKELLVYPNPIHDMCHIRTGMSEHVEFLLRIIDTQGRLVHSEKILQTSEIISFSLSNTPPGVYLLQLMSEDKAELIASARLIRQ